MWNNLVSESEPVGGEAAEVSPILANLITRAAEETLPTEAYRRRVQAIRRPPNLAALSVPRVPTTVWETMSRTARQKDLVLREVCGDLLTGISGVASAVATRGEPFNARQFGVAMQLLAGIKVRVNRTFFFASSIDFEHKDEKASNE